MEITSNDPTISLATLSANGVHAHTYSTDRVQN